MHFPLITFLSCTLLSCAGTCAEPFDPSRPLHDATRGDPLWTGRSYPIVAQPKERQDLFDEMTSLEAGSLTGAVLACEVTVDPDRAFDAFSGPDLAVTFRLGTEQVDVFAPDNRRHAVVFVPAVTLNSGDVFELSIWERDHATASDRVATLETNYEGRFPIRLKEGKTAVECRALTSEAVQTRLEPLLLDAQNQTKSLENARPNFGARDLSYPTKETKEARKAITRAAAWSGWNAAAVRALVKREKASQSIWRAAVVTKLRELNTTLPPSSDFVDVEGTKFGARVLDVICGEQAVDRFLLGNGVDPTYAPDCLLRIALRANDMDLRPTIGWRVWDVPDLLDVQVVLNSGVVVDGDIEGLEVDERWIPAASLRTEETAVHELVVVASIRGVEASPPQLVLAGRRSLRTPIRLPLP